MEWFDVITLWYNARIAVATNGVAATCENTTLSSNNNAEQKKKIHGIQFKDNECSLPSRTFSNANYFCNERKTKRETGTPPYFTTSSIPLLKHTRTPCRQSLACRHIPAWTMGDTRPQPAKWHNQLIPEGRGNLAIQERTEKNTKTRRLFLWQ